MNDEPPGEDKPATEGWYGRLRKALKADPATREDLLALLAEPHWREVLSPEELGMIHGVLQVAETQVRDVMVPRSQMVVLEQDAPREEVLRIIVESGHSRFPVIGEDRDEVIGVLLAKDMLRTLVAGEEQAFSLGPFLRPATFIPESKRLNTLLKEFRVSRNHMAIVVDEYGGVSGLLTIEDVLEEIVGDIDDETDPEEIEDIQKEGDGHYHVRALTRIEDFNEYFGSLLEDGSYDTIGGLVMHELGHLPRKGEMVRLGGFEFRVLQADRRRVHMVEVKPGQAVALARGAADS